jgi:glycosyltransferase involved in cell wall biosynthesis
MLTVVLATCNGARFIGEQLDSIAAQLQPDDEIIVSDDASTDDTVATITRREDRRIRILANRERVGYVRNFERAIAQATGSLVFFSDQDDVWLPGKVTALQAALQGSACAASDAVVVDEDLNLLHRSYFELRGVTSFSPLAILRKPPVIGATLACRRAYLASLLPVPAGVPHDFWITFNAAIDGGLQVIASQLMLYRRHASVASLSATGRKRHFVPVAVERSRLVGAWAFRRVRKPLL